VQVGVIGATGYAGLELVRILERHPSADIGFLSSQTYAGQSLSDVYPCPFENELVSPDQADLESVDLVFLCTPHGASAPYAKRALDAGCRCVDLSADFRIRDLAVYSEWYGEHKEPGLISEAVYGLTEIYREQIAGSRLVANPGCYPTGPLLARSPLLRQAEIEGDIIIDAKSGVSGAGAKPSTKTHFVSVHGNLSAYNVGRRHRHVPEMEQEVSAYSGREMQIVFVPHLLPVSRGILSTIYVNAGVGWTPERLVELWRSAYDGEPFVQVLDNGDLATIAHVVNTNRCALSVASAGREGRLIIVTALDNLLKGASGQAAQNMNVMYGMDERLGLV